MPQVYNEYMDPMIITGILVAILVLCCLSSSAMAYWFREDLLNGVCIGCDYICSGDDEDPTLA